MPNATKPKHPAYALCTAASALQSHRAAQLQLAGSSGLLAQRLGLVAAAPRRPTADEWLEVHLASQRRQDSAGDCSICLRPFGAQPQVLLSCSHTFHDACLRFFERWRRDHTGQPLCCPLCRCQAYHKRRIADAELLWRHTCATRIQAAWRGLAARRHHAALRRLLPPKHLALRRRWCADRLRESSAELVASVAQGACDIDALFSELSATTAAAVAVFERLDARCRPAPGPAPASTQGSVAAVAAPEARRPAGSTTGGHETSGSSGQQQQLQQQRQQSTDWEAVLHTCLQRDEQPECPICLVSLGEVCRRVADAGSPGPPGSGSSTRDGSRRDSAPRRRERSGHRGRAQQQRQQRQGAAGGLAVLSCSHAFHPDCLSALEAFAVASELGPPRCPCCRSRYDRLDLR